MKLTIHALIAGAVLILPVARIEGARLDLDAECDAQFKALSRDCENRKWFLCISNQAFRLESVVLPSDRDPVDILIRRTSALLRHLQGMPNPSDLAKLEIEFEDLLREAGRINPDPPSSRRALFRKAWRLQRRIALSNPLLDFNKILFTTSYWGKYNHCCDQYFGFNARPGGGLYMLDDAFSDDPKPRDLLAQARVTAGRLKGQSLSGGAFRSPELSYDGRTVFFAYSECKPVPESAFTPIPDCPPQKWNPGVSYHIFKLCLDTPAIVEQLTDGPWNEFDPCLLPNGRLMFISERRGGFGRCHGRPVPTYTLHSMRPDGGDIVCLSFHDTNEWQPSVTHDGMVVYTRWDYVDRGDCIAHHPWITYPDGRDPRALHGNYPSRRGVRPDMEMDIRAIPGSQQFVATAAPHHGQAYGSLVVFDPRIPDDGAMAPVRRLTPEIGFPETADQYRGQNFGSAWPLDEDFYLCVYSPPGSGLPHGLYLIDSFGNRTLLYRDSSLPCLGPIPLRSRPMPPVIPHATAVALPEGMAAPATGAPPPESVMNCVNVYESIKPWPTNTIIAALRVIQLFPKATPNSDSPRIGVGAESLARGVLGTVPVEVDGSVRFSVPAGRMLYFQALDTNGCAIQSMMSETYVHPGESLTCVGCHEERNRAKRIPVQQAIAFHSPPRRLAPEPEGSYPVSYPRLVQPVLDRYCVACHRKNGRGPDLSNGVRSYALLTKGASAGDVVKGFAYACSGRPPNRIPCETTPGAFGARASKLYALLRSGHHDVKLPPEAMRRITLWLDCNSVFYGAYHDLERQREGERVIPELN